MIVIKLEEARENSEEEEGEEGDKEEFLYGPVREIDT